MVLAIAALLSWLVCPLLGMGLAKVWERSLLLGFLLGLFHFPGLLVLLIVLIFFPPVTYRYRYRDEPYNSDW